MDTITISLPGSLKAFVEEQVAAKGYGNVSEYFRSLLRDAREREAQARLEVLLLEGLASGSPRVVDETFWADVRAEAVRRLRGRSVARRKR